MHIVLSGMQIIENYWSVKWTALHRLWMETCIKVQKQQTIYQIKAKGPLVSCRYNTNKLQNGSCAIHTCKINSKAYLVLSGTTYRGAGCMMSWCRSTPGCTFWSSMLALKYSLFYRIGFKFPYPINFYGKNNRSVTINSYFNHTIVQL